MMRQATMIVLGLTLGAAAQAHDFWIQPQGWQAMPGRPLPIRMEVGHGGDRQLWEVDRSKVLALTDLAAGGAIDLRPLLQPGAAVSQFTREFRREGLHIISLVSANTPSSLPAVRFNDYLAAEGLTPALQDRGRRGMTNAPGRELYSRRAKALIQVGRAGAADDRIATRPIGLTLEVVPLRNPYSLGADHQLPVQILFEGRPLPGALVKLTNLEFDSRPLRMVRTDNAGRATFQIPQVGSWLINVIWTKPVQLREAEFQTVFSSLTFGYPAKRPK